MASSGLLSSAHLTVNTMISALTYLYKIYCVTPPLGDTLGLEVADWLQLLAKMRKVHIWKNTNKNVMFRSIHFNGQRICESSQHTQQFCFQRVSGNHLESWGETRKNETQREEKKMNQSTRSRRVRTKQSRSTMMCMRLSKLMTRNILTMRMMESS